MEYLQVNSAKDLGCSSTIPDDIASICPLITPSPPTNALVNPLSESQEEKYDISAELTNKLQQVTDDNGDSSSTSNSSTLAEPAAEQLLSLKNAKNFPFLIKFSENINQEIKNSELLQLTFRNPPENYFFMSWNWPIIRCVSFGLFSTGLLSMLALVIAMIYSLPKVCNPEVEWYQGGLFYEIFPASFYDTNNGMTGDFRGISKNANYIVSLGVKVVRLNSIFDTPRYPEDYDNVSSLLTVARPLGDINDFRSMMRSLKSKNLKVILDLPILPFVRDFKHSSRSKVNSSHSMNELEERDRVEEALKYWVDLGVNGFYLKGMEFLVDDPNLGILLKYWKRIIGFDRIFIISELVLHGSSSPVLQEIILNNVNLIDVKLAIEKGANEITKKIHSIENSTLFTTPGRPWIHWTVGDESTKRLINRLPHGNSTLGAILLNMMLPGTPSIFYGDEISLQQVFDPQGHISDLEHLKQFTPMVWPNWKQRSFSWINGVKTKVDFHQLKLIFKMAMLRQESPSIYMNSVYRNNVNKANAEVKYSREDLLVIQRWFPRRKSYVIVSNLGNKELKADLSNLLYRGNIVVGPRINSVSSSISFKKIILSPGESVVVVLE